MKVEGNKQRTRRGMKQRTEVEGQGRAGGDRSDELQ